MLLNGNEGEVTDELRDTTEERTPSSTMGDRSPLSPEVELGGTVFIPCSLTDDDETHSSLDGYRRSLTSSSDGSRPSLEWIKNALRKKFKDIKELDEGGFGTVFTGIHCVDHNEYAIKVVDAEEEKSLQEAICMSNLTHENIVRYNDSEIMEAQEESINDDVDNENNDDEDDDVVFEDDNDFGSWGNGSQNPPSLQSSDANSSCHTRQGKKFLVIHMELCSGTLVDWLHPGKIRPDLMKQFSLNIVEGLMFIHNEGYMHRDLKPQNIFIDTKKGLVAKIGDFGSSRKALQHVSPNEGQENPSSKMTDYIGTKPYCAPELASGIYDKRVDLYSLAIILFDICYGKQHGKTSMEIRPIYEGMRSRNVQLPDDFQGPVRDIVYQCLQHDPEDRMRLVDVKEQLEKAQILENGQSVDATGDAGFSTQCIEETVRKKHIQPVQSESSFGIQNIKDLFERQMSNLQLQEETLKLQMEQYVRTKSNLTQQEQEKSSHNLQQQESNIEEQKRVLREDREQAEQEVMASKVQYEKVVDVKEEREITENL